MIAGEESIWRKELFLVAQAGGKEVYQKEPTVQAAGYRNLYTPYAELYHHESASRGYEDTPEKMQRFQREADILRARWMTILMSDPYYSPNLTLSGDPFTLAWPPRVEPFRLAAAVTP